MNGTFLHKIGLLVLAYIGSFISLSPILGSKCAFFKLDAIIWPVSGIFGFITALVTLVAQLVVKGVVSGSFTYFIYSLVYHVPSFCGALYFASLVSSTKPSFFKNLLVAILPLSCITLFVAHPIGYEVYYYSFFWIIPILTIALPHKNFFLHALGSTFTTHAVGSTLWLYTHATTGAFWHLLLPIVPFERLVLATGMTLLYYGLSWGATPFFVGNPLKNLRFSK